MNASNSMFLLHEQSATIRIRLASRGLSLNELAHGSCAAQRRIGATQETACELGINTRISASSIVEEQLATSRSHARSLC